MNIRTILGGILFRAFQQAVAHGAVRELQHSMRALGLQQPHSEDQAMQKRTLLPPSPRTSATEVVHGKIRALQLTTTSSGGL